MIAAFVAFLVLVLFAPAQAAGPGDLDPTFGADGRIALAAAGAFVPRAVGIDRADRIVVGGYLCEPDDAVRDGTCLTDGASSFRLARLTPDGGLDAEFGENGFVTTPIGEGRAQAFDLIVRPNGGAIAAGVARSGGHDVFALARYTPSGALDSSFGEGGVALAAVGTAYASLGGIAAGPDGTIVAAGQAVDAEGTPRMAVARFEADGDLDPTFGTGGVTLDGTRPYGYGLGVATRPSGNTVVAGLFGDSDRLETYRFGEIGVDGAGRLRQGATTEQSIGAFSFANAIAGTRNGWLAAGGAYVDGRSAMAAVRATDGGALVGGFGRRGRAVVGLLEGAVANDVVMERDRALLIGQAATDDGGYAFATVRLTERGRRDREFSGNGAAIVRWPEFPIARATAGALQGHGRLVTVGVGCAGGTDARCAGGTSRLLLTRQLIGSDRTAPAMRVARVPRRLALSQVRRLQVRVTLSEPGRLRAELWSGRERVGASLRRAPDDVFTVRVAVRRSVLARLRGRRLRLVLQATDLAGNRSTRRITFRIRR